mgnify:CR=1 FL=1
MDNMQVGGVKSIQQPAKPLEQQSTLGLDLAEKIKSNVQSVSTSDNVANVSKTDKNIDAKDVKKLDSSEGVKAENELSEDDAKVLAYELVDELNQLLESNNRSLEFSIDDSTEEIIVTVIDTETQEKILQYPSEDMLTLAGHLGDLIDQIHEGETPAIFKVSA